MKLRRIGFACLLVILGATTFFVRPASACTLQPPVEGEPIPTAEALESRIQKIPVIFEGTVTAISEDRERTTIKVSRYFKGDGPGSVTVLGFGWGTDCLPVTRVGQHAIFYTTGNPKEQLSIHSWGSTEAVNQEKVDAIIKVVGHAPVLAPDETLPGLAMVAFIGLGIIVVSIVALIWLKRKHKESE